MVCSYGFQRSSAGTVGSLQQSENPQNFQSSVAAEYMTVYSEQTDTPEVKYDLTDGHRPTTVTLLRMRAEG